jgi:uncharacterized glyoxalase superfamily protein PhnB
MSSQVSPVPDGFSTLTPHITVNDGSAAIDFYKRAFGAEEVMRMPGLDGKAVMHAELQIGSSRLMLNEEMPGGDEGGPKAPSSLKGTVLSLHLYVDDVDAAFKRAVDAGAKPVMPPMDMFWGDRYGAVTDPFGHRWSIATHTRDLTPDQIQKNAEEFFAQMGRQG